VNPANAVCLMHRNVWFTTALQPNAASQARQLLRRTHKEYVAAELTGISP